MSERELLESAAKAAGIEGSYFESDNTIHIGIWLPRDGRYWNPLRVNADAFALMVGLGIDVWRRDIDHEVLAVAPMMEPFVEHIGMDPEAATRRAIVRAAAEIGGAA